MIKTRPCRALCPGVLFLVSRCPTSVHHRLGDSVLHSQRGYCWSAAASLLRPVRADEPTLESLQQQLQQQALRIQQLESGEVLNVPPADAELTPEAATGASTNYEQSLQELQTRMDSLEQSGSELLQSLDSEFLESPSTDSMRTTTGRLHLDYWGFPRESDGINLLESSSLDTPPKDRFELRRIRLGVRGSVPPKNVTYQLDLEFSGIDSIGVRDAWIGIDDVGPFDTLRVGNQKRPYALDQLNSSNFTVFIERPMMVEAINDPNRRTGIQALGASADRAWNWRCGVFHLVPIEENGVISSNNYQPEFAGRLAWTPWYDELCDGRSYLHLACASSIAFPSEEINDNTQARLRTRPEARTNNRWLDTGIIIGAPSYQLVTLESVLNLGPVQIGGEFINIWSQRNNQSGADLHLHGGYLYVSWFLTGEHIPWNRELGILGRVQPFRNLITTNDGPLGGGYSDGCTDARGWGAWQLAGRLSTANLNDEDIFGGAGESASVALNWYWNSHTRLQINYIWGRIDDRLFNNGAGPGELVSGNYQIVGTRLMVDY